MRRFALWPLGLGLIGACTHGSDRIASHETKPVVARRVAFTSKNATEAVMRFSHVVTLAQATEPTAEEAREQVEEQIAHLFGPMERAEYMAAPKEDHRLANIRVVARAGATDLYDITYDYEGTIVLQNGPTESYEILLPNDPDAIYGQAMVGDRNPCTDDEYQGEGDFWYFWSPAPIRKECRLKEGEHYRRIPASIARIPKGSHATYPEYDRLADLKGEIQVALFYGMDHPSDSARNPRRSEDLNAENFLETKRLLRKMGFKLRRWTNTEIRKVVKVRDESRLPYIEEATLEYPRKRLKLRIRLFFGETGIDEASRPFHYFFRDALRNASVMIYDGHSGLGGHLDLGSIAEANDFRITPNKQRYQIYFFNSCTSYTYYNTKYFQRKRREGGNFDPKGTKNLDVLANGLSTAFEGMPAINLALVRSVIDWLERDEWTSYQRLADFMEADNLFTVNGDEDNPREPRRGAIRP